MAFDIHAELVLSGPKNINTVLQDIRSKFKNFQVNMKLKVSNLQATHDAIQRKLSNLNVQVNIKAGANLQGVSNKIDKLNTALIALAQNSSNANTALAQLSNTARTFGQVNANVSKQVAAAGAATQSTTKAVTHATDEFTRFGQQAGLAVRRFAAFTLATSAIFGFVLATQKGISKAIQFDKELTTLQQVTNFTRAGLKGLSKEISSLSVNFGVSSDELINVASTLKQAGLSAQETKTALKALAQSSLAPSFDTMNETVEGSIAIIRQFGIQAGELESVLGSVNTVSAEFAVESRDIITAVQIAGGAFAAASNKAKGSLNTFQEFIAVFTAVRQTTRESAESIATGLRTIFTRIQRGSTIEALKGLDIKLDDTQGKFIGAFKAVKALSEGLRNLDTRDPQFTKIAEELGGFRQINKVIPLISQFAVAQKALEAAKKGEKSLDKDAIIAQEALANSLAKVREQFLLLVRAVSESVTFRFFANTLLDVAKAAISVGQVLTPLLPVFAAYGAIKAIPAIGKISKGFVSQGGLFQANQPTPAGPGFTSKAQAIQAANTKSNSGVASAVKGNASALQANTTALRALTAALAGRGIGGVAGATKVHGVGGGLNLINPTVPGLFGGKPGQAANTSQGAIITAQNALGYTGAAGPLTGVNLVNNTVGKHPASALPPPTLRQRLSGIGSRISANRRGLAGAGAVAAGVGTAALIGDETPTKATASGAIAGATNLGLLGAYLGSIVPGVGTLAGGAIGATAGAVQGGLTSYKDSKLQDTFKDLENSASELDEALKQLREGTSSLKDEDIVRNIRGADALSGYAVSTDISSARDAADGARLLTERGVPNANKISDLITDRILTGRGTGDIESNTDLLRQLGGTNPTVNKEIAGISQKQSFVARNIYDFGGEGEEAEERIKKLQLEEGRKELRFREDVARAQKKAIEGAIEFGKKLDLLTQKFDTISSVAERVDTDLEGYAAGSNNRLNAAFGNGQVVARGGFGEIFSNPQAYSAQQINSAGQQIAGSNPQLQTLLTTFKDAQVIEKQLPKILSDAYEKSISDLKKSPVADEEADGKTNDTTAGYIRNALNKLNESQLGGNSSLINPIIERIGAAFSVRGTIVQPNDILADGLDKIIGDIAKQAQRTFEGLAKPIDGATKIYVESLNSLTQSQIKAIEGLSAVETAKSENRLSYAEAANRTPSLGELFSPFNAQVSALRSGQTPAAVGSKIDELLAKRNAAQNSLDSTPPELRTINNPNFRGALATVQRLDKELNIANKALALFATNVREGAIQTKLAELDARSEGARGLVETLATANGGELFNIQRITAEFARFKQTGELGQLPQQRQGVFEFAKLISPLLPKEGQQDLQRQLLEGFRGMVGPEFGKIIDQALEGLGKGGNERDSLLTALQEVQSQQVEALTKQADLATQVSTAFGQDIPNQLSSILSKLETLIDRLIPAEGKAAGGAIFRKQGTDTVPAMLTPGEFVVKRKEAQKNRGLLEQINAGYYAAGGTVDPSDPLGRGKRRQAYEDAQAAKIAKAERRQAAQNARGAALAQRQPFRTEDGQETEFMKAQRERRAAPYKKSGELIQNGPGKGLTRAQYATGLTAKADARTKALNESRGIIAGGPTINGKPIAARSKVPSINGVPIAEFREGRKEKAAKELAAQEARRVTVPEGTVNGKVGKIQAQLLRGKKDEPSINGIPVAEYAKRRSESKAQGKSGRSLVQEASRGKQTSPIADRTKKILAELAAASKPSGNEFEATSNIQDARRRLKNLPGNIAANARQRKREDDLAGLEYDSEIRSGQSRRLVSVTENLVRGANAGTAANGVGGIRESLAYQTGKREEQQARTNAAFEKSAASTKAYSDASLALTDKIQGKRGTFRSFGEGFKYGLKSLVVNSSLGIGRIPGSVSSFGKTAREKDELLRNKQYFAEGGSVDNIPIMASQGEYVVNKKAMMANGGLVHAINRGKVRKYAAGGPVGASEFKDKAGGGGYSLALDSTAQATLTAFSKNFMAGVDKMAAAIEEFVSMDKKITFEGTVKDIIVKVQGETEFAQFVTTTIKTAVEDLINARVSERMNPLTGEPRSA